MSQRDQPVLWLNARKGVGVAGGGGSGSGGATAGGGGVLLATPQHKLDGPEHLIADDTTDKDATTSEHGLLPKLDGDASHFLDGTGAWSDPAAAIGLDDLTDVVITSPATGDRLRFNGANWVNSSLRWEPQTDMTGSVVVTSTGDPVMVEVS